MFLLGVQNMLRHVQVSMHSLWDAWQLTLMQRSAFTRSPHGVTSSLRDRQLRH